MSQNGPGSIETRGTWRDPIVRRRALAGVLTTLAVFGAIGSAVGRWSHDVLLDADEFTAVVIPIGTDPIVVGSLTDFVTNELIDLLDAESGLETIMPQALGPIADLTASAINGFIYEQTREFFDSERYQILWSGIVTNGHRAAVALIRDEVPNVSTDGGVVTVDLEPLMSPIVDGVIAKVREWGSQIPNLILNQMAFDDAIRELISRYEVQGFPERLKSVEVYRSDTLAPIQSLVALFDKLVVLLPIVTVLLVAGAVWAAPAKVRMLAWSLLSLALGWLIALFVTRALVGAVVSGIEGRDAAEIAREILDAVTSELSTLLTILLVVAAVAGAAVAGWTFYTREQPDPDLDNLAEI